MTLGGSERHWGLRMKGTLILESLLKGQQYARPPSNTYWTSDELKINFSIKPLKVQGSFYYAKKRNVTN